LENPKQADTLMHKATHTERLLLLADRDASFSFNICCSGL